MDTPTERSFIIGDSNWKYFQVGYPVDTPTDLCISALQVHQSCNEKYAAIRAERYHLISHTVWRNADTDPALPPPPLMRPLPTLPSAPYLPLPSVKVSIHCRPWRYHLISIPYDRFSESPILTLSPFAQSLTSIPYLPASLDEIEEGLKSLLAPCRTHRR